MKKIFFIFTGLCFLLMYPQAITKEEAMQLATEFFSFKFGKSTNENLNIELIRENDTTFFYILSTSDSLSLLLAAHKLAGPFLAYSTQGKFKIDPENEALQYWLSIYKQIIRHVFNHPNDSSFYQKEMRFEQLQAKPTTPTNGFYLIKTQWAQKKECEFGCTYNKFVNDHGKGSFCSCGKCPAGCVAVAMGQIMRYWAQPAFRFDWCNMPVKLECNSPMVQINAIARLLADIGQKVAMKYCRKDKCQSGSTIHKAQFAFKLYGYTNVQLNYRIWFSEGKWLEKLQQELLLKRPVFYCGCESSDVCHAFVCDGFDLDHPNFFHFNWGWDGSNDGFYYIFSGDGEPLARFHKFQAAIFNIFPTVIDTCNQMLVINENYQSIKPDFYFSPTYFAQIKTAFPPDNVIISSGEKVIYSATDEITLEEGFVAEEGSDFIAQIIPCPASCKLANPTPNLDNKLLSSSTSNSISQTTIFQDTSLSIYPNPTSGLLFISTTPHENEKIQSISIIDISGKTLLHYPASNQLNSTITLDVSHLENGIYFLKLQLLHKESWKFLIKN